MDLTGLACQKCVESDWMARSKKDTSASDFISHISDIHYVNMRLKKCLEECLEKSQFFDSDEEIKKNHKVVLHFKQLMYIKRSVCDKFMNIFEFHLPLTVFNETDQSRAKAGLRFLRDVAGVVCKAADFLTAYSTPDMREVFKGEEYHEKIWKHCMNKNFCVILDGEKIETYSDMYDVLEKQICE